ncbi:MarR family winged helix-turn-helix transcriptional regulator [Pseudoduganella chitinolytica]|uniref:MarR family winged helix-turn-helix transcriptional regulator n=1 Tax=Pseudoduganella chitinolytica TaxID=34070 RepID=A0ABY8BG57_9BURK|nr:MarR family winged helix-turn-helix transcriptional regulator [Pseudoduganella chitinolytica]WEF33951.1 MarR family winged helix-turn-helix transcriptional regulator [Pseudoduganella chitinolytica]
MSGKAGGNGGASDSGTVPEDGRSGSLEVLQKLRVVIRAAQRHSLWIEKQCGVNGAQLWIMQELAEAPGLRVGQVTALLAIRQATTSNLLEGLVRKGFVVKTRDPADQRVVKLFLSAEGQALLEAAPKPARGLLPEALAKLEPAHLTRLNAGLGGLLSSIEVIDESFGLQPLPFTL